MDPQLVAFINQQVQQQVQQVIQQQVVPLQQQVQQLQVQLLQTNPFTADVLLNANLLVPQRMAVTALQNLDWQQHGSNHGLMVIHTGCGKSGIIASGVFAINPRPNRVLVIAPDTTIRDQLMDAMNPNGNPFVRQRNVIAAFKPLPSLYPLPQVHAQAVIPFHIVVTNIHRLQDVTTPNKYPPNLFDLIIVDEAHHYPAPSWNSVIQHFANAKVLFLTATPYRTTNDFPQIPVIGQPFLYIDARNANIVKEFVFDNITAVDPMPINDLTIVGSPTKQVSRANALERMKVAKFRNRVSYTPAVIQAILQQVLVRLNGFTDGMQRQAIAICRGSQLANAIKQSAQNLGINAVVINTSEDDFPQKKQDFTNGVYQLAIVNGMLGEGYDNPKIAVAAIFSAIGTLLKFIQFVGRAVRYLHGAQDQKAYIVTHELLNQKTLYDEYMNGQGVNPAEDLAEEELEEADDNNNDNN